MPAIVPTDSAGAAWSAESSGVSTVEKMSGLKKDSEVTYRKSNATMSQNRKRVLSTAAANEGVDEDELNAYLMIGSTLENTGAHGIPNIIRAKSPHRRILWAVLFLGGVGFFLWQGVTIIKKYYDYDVVVNLDIQYESTIDMPAITICNMNPITNSSLSTFSSELERLLVEDQTVATPPMPAGPTVAATRMKYQDWENVDLTDQDDRVDKLEEAIDIIGSAPYDQRNETGHKLDDMLLSCYFQNFPCFPENFTHFYNYMYGNCFTFNSGSKGRVLNVSKIGPLYGLSLELYIDQSEYISTIQPSAGIRLLIHNQHEMPFPEDQGINLAPGAHTSVGLSLVDIERLGHPYTNCSLDFAEGNIFRDKFSHLDYSRSTCEKNCFFKGVLENCKCADPRYRYDNSIPVCNTSIPRIDECVDQIEENYTLGLIPCNCTMPCRQQNYHYTISEAHWPNDGYMEEVKEGIAEISDSLRRQLTQDPNFIEDNVVKVGVFYDNLQFQYIYQTPAYDWYSLVSDLGGQVGLWIGVSVLTIFEFVELVYDLFKLCFMKMMDPRLKKRSGASRNDVMSLDVKNAGSGEKNVVFSQGFQ
ncbi:epithelial sodium channel subunit beta-like [Diadema antillarum]|uniref:epithelial sodium channel subunit beta-like n=1 Tax=Diadema antillarum TaxID=105358 RepID=UPI003A83DB5E